MTYSFKKNYAILMGLLMLLSVTSMSYASYDNLSNPSSSVLCDELQSDSICCEPACCTPCGDWIVTADFLYWRALQNGLECGCAPEIKDNWGPGYRIGLEYDTACNEWNIGTYWTHFHNDYKHKRHEDNFTHWNLKYDTIDVLVGYDISNNSCFNYAPYIGLRGARVNETLKAHFDDCNCYSTLATSETDQNHKQKFYGIGPTIGINADYSLGCGFSLYGSVGAGMLYGNFKINVHDFETIPDPTDDGACCVNKSIHACQAFIDLALGVEWEHCFCNNMELTTRLGVEHHRYFNQNRIGGYGDLIFDGVTLSFGLKF